MSLPALETISDENVLPFCRFLTEHLSRERTAEQWAEAFRQNWCQDKPNNGFLIRSGGRVVGGIGAIYSDRVVQGRPERFCNITSWCVLDEFRSQSMRLAMALTTQPAYHFTDLTPTEVVSKTLQFLKFRPMDERHAVWPNYPWPFVRAQGVRVMVDPERIEERLSADAGRVYRDHAHLGWLRHLVVGKGDVWCHVVWKPTRLKGIAGAMILHVSDPLLYLLFRDTIGNHLLMRHGLPYTRIEARLLPHVPKGSTVLAGYRKKVYRSDTLSPSDIGNMYSEIVALDL